MEELPPSGGLKFATIKKISTPWWTKKSKLVYKGITKIA
jgi:hypothetical protein